MALYILFVRRGSGQRNNCGDDDFAQSWMGDAEGGGFRDSGIGFEDSVYLHRRKFFATTIDDLLDPASQIKVAIVVECPQIAGAIPVIDKGLLVCHRVIEVTIEHQGTAYHNFAFLTGLYKLSIFIHNFNLVAHGHGHADGIDPACHRGKWIAGNPARFSAAQSGDYRRIKGLFESGDFVGFQPPGAGP